MGDAKSMGAENGRDTPVAAAWTMRPKRIMCCLKILFQPILLENSIRRIWPV